MSDIDETQAAWERLEAACAGLLAQQCKRHPPYMGCAMDCSDVANALDPEFVEARPLITAALAEVRRLRSQLEAARAVVEAAESYGERMDFACSRAPGEMYTCERQLMDAIDAHRAAKAKEQP